MRVLLSQFVCKAVSYLPSNCFMRGSVGGISWYVGACQWGFCWASCWSRGVGWVTG